METTNIFCNPNDSANDLPKFVLVPFSELQKLEESRLRLYEYFDTVMDMSVASNVMLAHHMTKQVWYVANQKLYDKSLHIEPLHNEDPDGHYWL